ncbi:phage portal protein, SPP1 family [Peptoniphilus sp. ING2-D1G]|nr:phage portal protein, SPP1 family [Peptoniphilus sp. ING2-D1G]
MDSYITNHLELPRRICLPNDTEISEELIKKLLKLKEKENERYQTLQGYYEGKAKINERQKDQEKANNKLVLDYPSYIVDILLGLFVGKPISYTVREEDKEKMSLIQDVLDLNDEQDENTEIAKMIGIKGKGYEIVYVDEESNIRFNEVNPENIIVVYDDSINPEPLFAIYMTNIVDIENIDKETKDMKIIVYQKDAIQEYISKNGDFYPVDNYINPFGEVPIIEFLNNNEAIGDFERVLSLIDAMNLSQSDTANDFEEFTNAILVLNGMLDTDSEDIRQLIEDRVILLDSSKDGNQSASWLIKSINDTALENYKNRLDADIHKFAKVPNLGDEHFASNISGESMKYKLFATNQIVAQKQRKFKTALQTRFRLIINALNIKNGMDFDYRDISIIFNENTPFNELDNINTVKAALDAGLSKQYALGKLRDIDDIQEEIQRQQEEREAYADAFLKAVEEQEDERGLPETSEGF